MTQAQDNPADTDTSLDLRDYLDATFGATAGRAHIAVGRGGHFDASGAYKFPRSGGWAQRSYAWPAERDQITAEILRTAPESDVYLCPYLMSGRKRTPGDAVELTKIHADIDGDCPLDKVAEIGGWAVSTGSPGHAHVYVDLAEPVPAHWHTALCRGLGAYLGDADAKIRANDVLRPPGTLNHKSRARGGESTAVEWLIRPSGVRWDAAELADRLDIALPDTPDTGTKAKAKARTGTGATGTSTGDPADADGEPVDLNAHPPVRRALVDVSNPPDRSVDTMKVVAAVYDSGLTLEHARWAVAQRADLAERLDGRRDDDVLTCWLKIDADCDQVTMGLDDGDDGDGDDGKMPGQARFTDAGLAEIVAAKALRGKFLRARGVGWLHWTGTHWRECGDGPPTEAVRKFVMGRMRFFARKLADDPSNGDLLDAIDAWKKVGSAARITAVLTDPFVTTAP